MNNEFISFHRPAIDENEIQSVVDTLKSGWLTTGPKVKRFEEDFARYLGCSHAVAVNSGTAALHLALDGAHLFTAGSRWKVDDQQRHLFHSRSQRHAGRARRVAAAVES